jgi:ABC-type multidrug transport system permease subunit
MLGGTLFVLIFFTYLGRFTDVEDEAFFVVGNAVYISSISCVYGSIMAIANERFFGTLSPLLATPANRLALIAGRSLPYIANGILVSAFGFAMSWLLLDFDPPLSSLGPLAIVVTAGVVSCTAFGMFLGSIGQRHVTCSSSGTSPTTSCSSSPARTCRSTCCRGGCRRSRADFP